MRKEKGMASRIVVRFLVLIAFSLVGLGGTNLAQANLIDLYSFDFGTNSSPVQNGWIKVTDQTLYLSQSGYGWDANPNAANHSGITPPEYPDMLRDFNHSAGDRTFMIDLAAGTYSIELYFYDTTDQSAGNIWSVYLGSSSTVLATVTGLSKNTEVTRGFDITMASAGQLDLRFNKTGNGNWEINGINVAQEAPVPPTLLLLGTGLLGLTLIGRKRKGKES
jgi:hypothetical protein